ncbi:MAG: type II toxin-antitoxin system RelE/ParE family toxin [Azonexus sp.]|nr:type II toxin-antitoxin system RelE/ParE family toxin [Azonexus sp.]
MSFSVVFLKFAEQEVKDLKSYVGKKFGKEAWQATLSRLRDSINTLQTHPNAGKIPDELGTLNPPQYREIVSGMNRIIYEIRQRTIYIHVVCDSRRDMQGLLTRRVLRGE